MLPFYYRAYKYEWNENRYRTPGVDATKTVPEIGANGVELSPQGFPEQYPGIKGRKENAPKAREASNPAPRDAFLEGEKPLLDDTSQKHFHIPSQWDAREAMRSLGIPQFLVALDAFALKHGILKAAQALAKLYRAQIQLVHIANDSETDGFEELQSRLKQLGASYPLHTASGSQTAEAILQEARKSLASLLLLSTHGREGKALVQQGSIAEEVAKQADIPVLIHRPATSWSRIKKILVPFANLPQIKDAAMTAAKLSKGFGAELWMMHVQSATNHASSDTSLASAHPEVLPQTHTEFREVNDRGGIAESISAFAASEHVDLIVMSSHREDMSQKILSEGIAAQLLRSVDCSVWVVPQ